MGERPHLERGGATAVIAAMLVASGGVALGHDPPRARVTALTDRIGAEPSNASLLLERGDLLLVEERWLDALGDYDLAIVRGAGPVPLVHGRRAEALLEAGLAGAALVASELALAGAPASSAAGLARARALGRLGRFEEAAADYERVLPAVGERRPEHVLEHAGALAAIDTVPARAHAIAVLDAGGGPLGRPVALELAALELEIELMRWDDALRRVDELTARARRREAWLLRRAAILERAGRCREALDAWAAGLAAIEALPARHRTTAATAGLEDQARDRLAYLAAAVGDHGSDMR